MTSAQAFRERRQRLARLLPPGTRVLLRSGAPLSRNYPANHYPFRACSHFLYFCGWNGPHLAAVLQDGICTFYYAQPSLEDSVWEGPGPDLDELKARYGYDAIVPPGELVSEGAWTVGTAGPACDALRDAIIRLRLEHDAAAREELRDAARLTVKAHQAGRQRALPGSSEHEVLAALLEAVHSEGGCPSFHPIVSIHGETLHIHQCGNRLSEGDLLLVDFGAENLQGWAGDVTRTHPVGKPSQRQDEIYQVVLQANRQAIEACRPGTEFRSVHDVSAQAITRGLVDLGLLKGDPLELWERGAHTLFYVHGVGHLLGQDVHDMEDFGDHAGYAPGRQRSQQFGTCYLRLDRPLAEHMAVTIEPGFYWIAALLENPNHTDPFRDCLNFDVIRAYREVRGIRIEDDVLITSSGCEVLTADLTK